MNICVPILKEKGLESRVCEHFGSAPAFLLVDTETRESRVLPNRNQHHAHGQCRPLDALAGQPVDAVVVGGIGRGAFMGLTRAGIQVLLSAHRTVEETLAALAAGQLQPVDPTTLCGGHGHGNGDGHGQGHGHGHGHRHGQGGCHSQEGEQ